MNSSTMPSIVRHNQITTEAFRIDKILLSAIICEALVVLFD